MNRASRTTQQGAALIVAMVLLLIVTILVLSSSQTTVLQERMTSAIRDANVSLAIAERAVNDAESTIEALASTASFSATGAGGFYSIDNGPASYFDSATWANSLTVAAGTRDGITARYFIEELGIISIPEEDLSGVNMMGYGQTTGGGDVTAFKIVVRTTGLSGNAERIVVVYYGKRM